MQTPWYKKEWLIIAVVWMLIFASDPLYMYYAELVSQFDFRWDKILNLWFYTLSFFVMFIIHHYVLVPKMIVQKKVSIYITGAMVLLIAFLTLLILKAPDAHHEPWKSAHTATPPPLLTPPDLARLVIAVLMMVADLGAVSWFNEQKLYQRLLLLEKQNLKQELEHLRYQINPHFFMNTLNNIHALVDIDQERAKRAIVELSGMMRYSLYEGNDSKVPLQHELEFLQLYISLMKLRFNNKVELYVDLPEASPAEVMIPPLLFATFVENAFKHGISYQNPSYIAIQLVLEDENRLVHFHCENSLHIRSAVTQDGHHGIGLVNVRKRLDLQYTEKYSLTCEEKDNSRYVVDLILPSL